MPKGELEQELNLRTSTAEKAGRNARPRPVAAITVSNQEWKWKDAIHEKW
jgi:hypothetical protein